MVARRHPADVCRLALCAFSRCLAVKLSKEFSGVPAIFKTVFPFVSGNRSLVGSPRQAICSVLNQFFTRQPAVLELLSKHAGQAFRLHARPIDATMTIGHDGYLSAADEAIIPDVELSIDTAALLEQGWRPGQPVPEGPGIIRISGDAALAQTLSVLANSWRPDFEDLLSSYVGDIAANRLVAGVKGAIRHVGQAGVRMSQNLAEYAAYEADLLTPRVVFDAHVEDLSSLRARLQTTEEQLHELDRRLQGLRAMRSKGAGI